METYSYCRWLNIFLQKKDVSYPVDYKTIVQYQEKGKTIIETSK